jgi:hypothetical protein
MQSLVLVDCGQRFHRRYNGDEMTMKRRNLVVATGVKYHGYDRWQKCRWCEK